MKKAFLRLAALTFFVFLSLGGMLMAQTATGQITGTVTDSSGAVVPQAHVALKSQLTGATREATTNASGNYVFALLPVGVYSVTAKLQGFCTAKRSDIRLNVDQVARVDLELAVGEVTQTVEVKATTATIDTDTSTVGQMVSERQVTQLPLNGRNFLQLLFLGNGAVETSGEQGSMRQGVGNAISINGSRPTSNNYMIDGTSNTDRSLNTPAVILSVDAIQEFKEQTTTYSAQYGYSANQISIISKSGTNDFHGALFWFMRNNKLDARSFFETGISPLRQNQFGFVAGGPVYLPKIYNGHNKTFWLVNYEGTRIRRGFQRFDNVPLPSELAGRFSSTIIDPFSGLPFPGNVIPEQRFSRLDKYAAQHFWPAPNIDLPQGNHRTSRSLPNDTHQETYRLDQNLGKYGTVFARGTLTDFTNMGSHSRSEEHTSELQSH